jgi:hypothetical protein
MTAGRILLTGATDADAACGLGEGCIDSPVR